MTALLKGSSYSPRQGGHAPGDVRDAFAEALDAFDGWKAEQPEPTVELRDQPVPITQVFGLLWNCHDILPGHLFDQLCDLQADDPETGMQSRTYGAAARWLKQRPPMER